VRERAYYPGSRTWFGRADRIGDDALITIYDGWVVGFCSAPGFHGTGQSYDVAVWGSGDNGESFCCLFHDASEDLTKLELKGSDNEDDLALTEDGVGSMCVYAGNGFTAALSGREDDDSLTGSNCFDATYDEFLRGQNGDDVIWGGGGADELRGGLGADDLYGQSGADLLIAGAGADELSGGDGADILCTENAGDLLLTGASSNDEVYISSSASGSVNVNNQYGLFATCGHTSWSLGCTYSAATAPSECASAGIPD